MTVADGYVARQVGTPHTVESHAIHLILSGLFEGLPAGVLVTVGRVLELASDQEGVKTERELRDAVWEVARVSESKLMHCHTKTYVAEREVCTRMGNAFSAAGCLGGVASVVFGPDSAPLVALLLVTPDALSNEAVDPEVDALMAIADWEAYRWPRRCCRPQYGAHTRR